MLIAVVFGGHHKVFPAHIDPLQELPIEKLRVAACWNAVSALPDRV